MSIEKGELLINSDEAERIDKQRKWQNLYNGTYIFKKQLDPKTVVSMEQLIPIAQTVSSLNSSLLFGEFPDFDFQDETTNELVWSKLPNNFNSMVTSACELCSAVGEIYLYFYKKDDVVKWTWFSPVNLIVEKDDEGKIESVKYFKDMKVKDFNRIKYEVKEWELNDQGKLVITDYVVITEKDSTIFMVDKTNEEVTDWEFIPFIYTTNLHDMVNTYGRSDYKGIEDLFGEIDNRVDQINSVLNDHADPWVALPAGVLGADGRFHRENGKVYEKTVTGTDGDISIAQWDARLDSAFDAVDKMIEMILFTTRISPALAGYQKGGMADSGRALKWRSIATFSMVATKRRYWEDFFYSFFDMWKKIDTELSNVDVYALIIKWQDGLPLDETEEVSNVSQAVNSGIMSKLTAIKRTQELDDKQAQEELGQIGLEAQSEAQIEATSNAIVV
jgi:hypothetical protein